MIIFIFLMAIKNESDEHTCQEVANYVSKLIASGFDSPML
jgi:hypothetical protein